jgi:hypothetical protein
LRLLLPLVAVDWAMLAFIDLVTIFLLVWILNLREPR